MSKRTNLSAGRQALRAALRELEQTALQGRTRMEAINAASRWLERAGLAKLGPTTVGSWFEAGSPAKDFRSLWALVRVLLEWSGQPAADTLTGASRGRATARWQSTEELWKSRWEQAKETRPRTAALANAPLVDAYLKAARSSARQHPYPGISGEEARLPSLADVYVRQQAGTPASDNPDHPGLGGTAPTGSTAGPAVPATEVFRTDSPLCLLLAGPGGGKSTLLRAHLADSAADWLNNSTGKTIPVMVSARDLTGTDPFPAALAKAATSALRQFGLLDELTADFFRYQARTGVPWLVLVDGLDEIPDTDMRDGVLRMLASATAQEPELYRFVVATRPLPAREIDTLGRKMPRFELRPFSPVDLLSYAERCFRGLNDPLFHAHEFSAGLRRSRLDVLARTPLMASMLCQLYTADPARPLPDGRTGAYESFVELIYEQNVGKNIRNAHDEAIRLLKEPFQVPRHHRTVELAAQQVADHLPELIDYLAYSWVNGSTVPAAEILSSHIHVNRPEKVKKQSWKAFLDDLLRPTGLLAQRGEDFVFLHQTLLEYHAARHATRDEQARTELLRGLVASSNVPGTRHREPPGLEPSYLGFLLDGLLAPGDQIAEQTTQYLDELTAPVTGETCRFLATQVELGTNLAPGLTAPRLIAFAESGTMPSYYCVYAAVALTGLEGYWRKAAILLADLAQDYTLNGEDRVWAAEVFAGLDGHREEAANLLARLIHDTSLDSHSYDINFTDDDYQLAVEALARLDRHRATSILAGIAQDTTLNGNHRSWAASMLVRVEKSPPEGLFVGPSPNEHRELV
ncbi:NACHT domain-containing protein [Streptomyces sp. NPDC057575]|uniref:NACHT domain-containing protein n=1 Tax=unclassified Streptomyces TaxID=2593676 RepID=UPI0036891322